MFIALACLAGCSSPDSRRSTEPDESAYESSQASAAAYGMESAFLGKSQKVRPANDFQFYYKNCSQTDSRAHYSKTSYWCNDR
ncbi:MAG: hypothetical protein V4760_07840 [Bdellovibrionota bacterium]